MKTLLHIDSSPLSSSVTREMTREFVKSWKANHPDGRVFYRDLVRDVPTPLGATWIHANFTPEDARTGEQVVALAESDQLIAELEGANEYVFGVPMHNFSAPAVFKLWIDQVARSGRTFQYGEKGPEGLLKGKKATILTATGGVYDAGTPFSSLNFVEPYLRSVFGFLGVGDVTFVTASGVARMGRNGTDRESFLKPTLDEVRSLAA